MGTISIRKYESAYEKEWDAFIDNSINGIFLQSKKFLNYHGNRFEDYSLMIYDDENLIAVCPACITYEDKKRIFNSHKGSTYGSIIIQEKYARLELLFQLVDSLENYLKENGFNKIVFKPTLKILCKKEDDALVYALYQKEYREYKELNLYLDYANYNEDIIENLSKLKKRQIKKCLENDMTFRELAKEEISMFHEVLSENLLKFDAKPVHTVYELIDLKYNRFPDIIKFFGAFKNEELLSGTMVFDLEDRKCAHTQYLAAKKLDSNLSPMSFIYYNVAKMYYEKGYKYLSWGIATEHYGDGINWGLMRNKEEFGSSHCNNIIFEKNI